jgi:DNA invertase Pin-like site-specific DNA recombinase
MRVAIYARVSTSNHGQDVEMQLRELREFAGHRGFTVTGEYVDSGVSGAKDNRPALDRLMKDARARKFDAIVSWKLDRFGRSLRHIVNALAELESVGVAFISLKDNLDLTTPAGRLMFQIVAAFAEFERETIRQRVISGLAHAKSKGRKLGRPSVSADGAEIARLKAEGLSFAAIAERLGVSVGTAYSVFKAGRAA